MTSRFTCANVWHWEASVARLWVWWSGVRFPAEARYFSLLQSSDSYQPYIYWVPYPFTRRYSGRGVKLTTHPHLGPRSRMSGAIHLLPLYAFMAWTGTTLLFLCFVLGIIRRLRSSLVWSLRCNRTWICWCNCISIGEHQTTPRCLLDIVGNVVIFITIT